MNDNGNEPDYTELNRVAKSMGFTGKDGHYVTALGLEIDATACNSDRLALGYLIARIEGHSTKW